MDLAPGLIFNIQKYSIHDGPGIRTTVFLKGCPLRCGWCSNPESQSPEPQQLGDGPDSRLYTVPQVTAICLQDRDFYEESGGGVTLSGGEPFTQPDFVLPLLEELNRRGIHTAIETTGCVSSEIFREAAQRADLLLFDVKHHDAVRHREGAAIGNERILENLRWAIANGVSVLPRIPVIPGYNDGVADAAAFAGLLRDAGATRVQLLPFHQMGDRKYTLLGKEYAYQGVSPLYPEDLAEYRDALVKNGVDAFF